MCTQMHFTHLDMFRKSTLKNTPIVVSKMLTILPQITVNSHLSYTYNLISFPTNSYLHSAFIKSFLIVIP
jgi:hypothetical protein